MSDRYVACPICCDRLVLRAGRITCPRCNQTFELPVEDPDAAWRTGRDPGLVEPTPSRRPAEPTTKRLPFG
jgi:uncharacterized Zn finger protein (UPF0148 family)